MSAWIEHVDAWKDCQRCPLGRQRSRICLARGSVPCDVLFVGEAPGVSEDAIGLPFKGPAGHLLNAIIERAIPQGMAYSLTNLVACFPREAKQRGDNEPKREEILACRPRLVEFINIARPRLIVCVGVLAEQYMHFSSNTPMVKIDHPAYILRMPLAQQQMATQKCVVQISNALEDVLKSSDSFKPWEYESAEVKSKREDLRTIYRIGEGINPEDDIPF